MAQSALSISDARYDLRRHGRARRLLADEGAALRNDARLTESIEHQIALDPREAIIGRLAYGLLIMGVAPMETGLAPVVSCAQILDCRGPLTDPELALRWTAREDDMWANFSISWRTVASAACRTPDVPSSGAAGNRDQNVLLRPIAFVDNLAQLVESSP